jgi:hypothetical protein
MAIKRSFSLMDKTGRIIMNLEIAAIHNRATEQKFIRLFHNVIKTVDNTLQYRPVSSPMLIDSFGGYRSFREGISEVNVADVGVIGKRACSGKVLAHKIKGENGLSVIWPTSYSWGKGFIVPEESGDMLLSTGIFSCSLLCMRLTSPSLKRFIYLNHIHLGSNSYQAEHFNVDIFVKENLMNMRGVNGTPSCLINYLLRNGAGEAPTIDLLARIFNELIDFSSFGQCITNNFSIMIHNEQPANDFEKAVNKQWLGYFYPMTMHESHYRESLKIIEKDLGHFLQNGLKPISVIYSPRTDSALTRIDKIMDCDVTNFLRQGPLSRASALVTDSGCIIGDIKDSSSRPIDVDRLFQPFQYYTKAWDS